MLNDQKRWLDEALALPCDSIVTRQEATEYLQPLLKRCNAKSKKTFWQWLRIQLARHEETANHLAWMQESRCPLEIVQRAGFQYVINGDAALIEVGDADPCVWRVPVSRLQWAFSMFPVAVKRLPALESEQTKQIRKLKRQFKCKMPYLTPDQRDAFVRELEGLESMSKVDTSAPRYMLIKYQDGRETPVHRLYLDAGPNDEVDAVDGDFLNFGMTKVRVTVEPVPVKGLVIAKGDQQPSVWTHECEVPNLQIVNSEEAQQNFEANHLQIRLTAHGDIKEASTKILPNASWTDAKFQPLTPSEIEVLGRGNVELDSDRPKDVSKLCREQSDRAKEFNSKQWRTIPMKK